jgi:uncharacterized protein affecting Mg2+/Co2+ transport
MTKNDTSSAVQAGATFTGSDGVQRRTIVAGAAWTIPVVATAIGAPLAAASGEAPTLAFTNGPFTVAACGTLKDVVLKATTDGTTVPPTGTLVTVTLPAGLTWSNGETGSRPFSTDANGEVVLSGVKAVATSGSRTITASSAVASASAPVAITAAGGAFIVNTTTLGSPTVRPTVPSGSTVVGQQSYLAPNGDLYYMGTLVASNVSSASAENTSAGVDYITYVSNGTAYIVNNQSLNTPTVRPTVPSGSTVVGQQSYLAPNGDLYYMGTLVASNVSSASAENTSAGVDYITYVSNGTAYIVNNQSLNTPTVRPTVPSGSTVVGQQSYLAPNGDLYYMGTLVASNVFSASAENTSTGVDYVTYTTAGDC